MAPRDGISTSRSFAVGLLLMPSWLGYHLLGVGVKVIRVRSNLDAGFFAGQVTLKA